MAGPDIEDQDPELVRDALQALLEIAWQGEPPALVDQLRAQAADLSDETRRTMLEGLLDQSILAAQLENARAGELEMPETVPMDQTEAELVDAALEPLIELVDPEAIETVEALDDDERAAILFKAVQRED